MQYKNWRSNVYCYLCFSRCLSLSLHPPSQSLSLTYKTIRSCSVFIPFLCECFFLFCFSVCVFILFFVILFLFHFGRGRRCRSFQSPPRLQASFYSSLIYYVWCFGSRAYIWLHINQPNKHNTYTNIFMCTERTICGQLSMNTTMYVVAAQIHIQTEYS